MKDNPKIFGITVSKNYSDLLKILVENNSDVFDTWFIVTQEDDIDTINLIKNFNKENIILVYYPLVPKKYKKNHKKSKLQGEDLELSFNPFAPSDSSKEVIFDKGGALRTVQKLFLPKYEITNDDLVLVIDSDVVLPKGCRELILNKTFEDDCIYGSSRHDYLKYSDFKSKKNKKKYYRENSIDGYFHLYKYNPHKLYKRTIDCGWVDLEFVYQFSKKTCIRDIVISHLGRAGINWKGRTSDCFLFDNLNFEYLQKEAKRCGIEETLARDDLVKKLEKKYISNSVNLLLDKPNLPDFVIPGFPMCGTYFLRNRLKKHTSVQFASLESGDIDYCSPRNFQKSSWRYKHEWYRSIFLRDGNTWGDIGNNYFSRGWDLAIDQMKKIYVETKWDWMNDVKFIVIIRNPINRLLEQYDYYMKNIPVSSSWNWLLPGKSLEENIEAELGEVGHIVPEWEVVGDNHRGRFLLDGYYSHILRYFKKELNLTDSSFLCISYEKITSGDKEEWDKIFKFLEIEFQENITKSDTNVKSSIQISKKLLAKIENFYDPLNLDLVKLIGDDKVIDNYETKI